MSKVLVYELPVDLDEEPVRYFGFYQSSNKRKKTTTLRDVRIFEKRMVGFPIRDGRLWWFLYSFPWMHKYRSAWLERMPQKKVVVPTAYVSASSSREMNALVLQSEGIDRLKNIRIK